MIFHIVAQVKYAQSWTALFRAFSSHRQPSAIFSKVFPAFFFFVGFYGFLDMCEVWKLWECNGSSIELCIHFFKHPQGLRVMIVYRLTQNKEHVIAS